MTRWVFHSCIIGIAFWAFTGCSGNAPDGSEPSVSLKDELPGKWRATDITVHIADSLTGAKILQTDEATLREKPILWTFEAGNRYRTISGAGATESRGVWNAFGDTLMMIEPGATYQYLVSFSGKEAFFRATLDWDGDGKEDDNYVGRFERE